MKKIINGIVAVLLACAMVVVSSPANAATSGLSCNQSNTTGALHVVNNNGLWAATGWVGDSGSHQWGWQINHNGNRLASGSATGSFNTGAQSSANFAGNDTFRFHVWNAAGTIDCNAYVTVS